MLTIVYTNSYKTILHKQKNFFLEDSIFFDHLKKVLLYGKKAGLSCTKLYNQE